MVSFLSFFLILQTAIGFSIPRITGIQSRNRLLSLSQQTNDSEELKQQQDLLEKAKSLRKEAQLLEETLLRNNPSRKQSTQEEQQPLSKIVKVTKLEDSYWTVSYRFSSQPKDDDDDNIILPNYSGKMMLHLRADGYSEYIVDDDDDETNNNNVNTNKLIIKKIWGWDKEYSNDDQQNYLLFSMDVEFPKSDPKLGGSIERCYFQARIDNDDNKDTGITLNDGTVTVKKDIAEKTKGMWGLFQVGGILTQFRYVGDFIAKPAAPKK